MCDREGGKRSFDTAGVDLRDDPEVFASESAAYPHMAAAWRLNASKFRAATGKVRLRSKGECESREPIFRSYSNFVDGEDVALPRRECVSCKNAERSFRSGVRAGFDYENASTTHRHLSGFSICDLGGTAPSASS